VFDGGHDLNELLFAAFSAFPATFGRQNEASAKRPVAARPRLSAWIGVCAAK
jgi:hypothetical protein